MAETFNVSSRAELLTALSRATGGDTIVLQDGNYGKLSLSGVSFNSEVTIASSNPAKPAVFTGLDLRSSENITFDGITFDYQFTAGDPSYLRPFNLSEGCRNITIRNSTFDGDVAHDATPESDGYGTATGLGVSRSTGITIENNSIFSFHTGLIVGASDEITVRGNNVHSIRSDGMDFAEVSGVLIEENWIHDFRTSAASADHCDMIQFWTYDLERPVTDIVIRGNILDIGDGNWSQSIFMVTTLTPVDQPLFRSILIEDNVIVNGHLHGITVGEAADLTIRNNSLLHNDGGSDDGVDNPVEIPRINVAINSTGVIITDNLTAAISGWTGQAGWTVSGNVLVQDQDPLANGYYNDVFLASSLHSGNGVHSYILLPSSLAAETGAGAAASQPDAGNDLVAARFHVTEVMGNGAGLKFDARFSTALPSGTVYEWDFGDGSDIVQGAVVRHRFPEGGMFDVLLTLRLPDGTVAAAFLKVGIVGPRVLGLGENGHFVAYGYGTETDLGAASTSFSGGLRLGAPGTVATIAAEHVSDIGRTDEIVISGRLKADSLTSAGQVFGIHGSFVASITDAGELLFRFMKRGGGETTFTTNGANLDDTSFHQFSIRIHGSSVAIRIDGVTMASGDAGGTLGWLSRDLTFGSPWGEANFAGILRAFSITVDGSDYTGTGSSTVLDPGTSSGGSSSAGIGSPNDDIYLIDGLSGRIRDAGGIDEVQSSLQSIDLRQQRFDAIENATLLGSQNLNLQGDEQNNRLVGNSGDNFIRGWAGADTMIGGLGNDRYIIDHVGDRIIEGGNGGLDRVGTSVSLTLFDNVENAWVIGGAPVNLTGNILGNRLTGNGSANILDGGGGADTMLGGRGSDVYIVDNPGDVVREKADGGTDTVRSLISYVLAPQVENGILIGTAATNLTGNALDNNLLGNSAANVLDGGRGNDRLTGGGGADTFVFGPKAGQDVVTDFTVSDTAHDRIDLSSLATVTDYADLIAHHLRQSGANAVIDAGNGNVLTLMNVQVTDLTEDHFLF